MTFRAAVAAGLMAAVSLACTEAPKSRPATKQAKVVTPLKKLGSYTMTITPMGTASGRQARVQVVPDVGDGNPATNPAGTIQVAGTFANVVEPAGGNGCAGPSLNLPLTVTNFSREPLVNVQVQITEMARAGFEACKPGGLAPGAGDPALLPVPANTSPGAAFGLANYGTLSGAPTNVGTVAAGGTNSIQWWFSYPSNTPTTFKFVVWADPRQPELTSVSPLAIGSALSWSSTGSATSRVELCATDPAATNFACPAPVVGNVTSPDAIAPYTFAWIPPGLTGGATYYWRALNTFGALATDVANYSSGWDSFVAEAPFAPAPPTITAPTPVGVVAPFPTFEANVIDPLIALPIDVSWLTGLDVIWTHIQVCDTVDCLPGAPGVGLLDEAWVAGDPVGAAGNVTGYTYLHDVSLMLPTDPLLLDAQLQTGVYFVNVYAWDDVNGLDVSAAAASAFEIVPPALTPVPNPTIVGPIGPELDPLVLREQFPANAIDPLVALPIQVQWTTDASVTQSFFRLCDTPDCLPAAGLLGELTVGTFPGFQPVAGGPNEYSIEVSGSIPLDPNSGGIWMTPGIYYFGVTNVDPTNAPFGAEVMSSFLVVSSMPALPGQMQPANGTPFSQQSYVFVSARQVSPVVVQWSSPAEVVEGELEIAYTPDFAVPFTMRVAASGTAGGLNTYSYDLASLPLLDSDMGLFPLGSGGSYLQPGLVYWRVYNVEAGSGNFLTPPSAIQNIDITAFNPGWAVSVSAPPSTLVTVTGASTMTGAYVQLCDTADCLPVGAFSGVLIGAEGSTTPVSPGVWQVSLASLATAGGVAPGTVVYFRLVDDEVALGTFFNPPAGMWFYPTVGAGTPNYPVTLP